VTRADGTLGFGPRLGVIALVGLGAVLALVDPFTLIFFLSYALVGMLLVFRRPRNIVSWILLVIAFGFVGTTSTPPVDVGVVAEGRGSFVAVAWAWVYSWSGYAVFLAFAVLAFLFPAGRLPLGRWRAVTVAALVVGLAATVATMVAPTFEISLDGVHSVDVANAFAVAPDLPFWPFVPPLALAIVIAAFALGVLSMVDRYRSAAEVTRLQLRWLLAAVAFVLLGIVTGLVLGLTLGDELGGLVWLPAIAAYPTVPIAIAFAVFRYRLYEIDRIVNRAVVYGTLTAILAGVFAALTAVSQRLFLAATGQTSEVGLVLTTLVVATLYAPVRKRVEGAVDTVFKYDERQFGAYRDQLSRLLELVDPSAAAGRLAHEILTGTGAVGVAIADRDGEPLATAGTWPVGEAAVIAVPGHSPFSAVLLGPRRDGRVHEASSIASVAEIAALASRPLEVGARARLVAGSTTRDERSPRVGQPTDVAAV
jgi:two-component system NarL family sensor kinase